MNRSRLLTVPSNVSSASRQPGSAASRIQPAANLSATRPCGASWLDVYLGLNRWEQTIASESPSPHTTIDRAGLRKWHALDSPFPKESPRC
jgi:hypothetical protein